MKHRPAALLTAVALGAAQACGGSAPPPTFSAQWPAKPGRYEVVHESWTRTGHIYDGYDKALEVFATFKSPEWRAARVDWLSRDQRLTATQRAELQAAEEKADAEFYELELLVSTYEDDENDLARGKRSVWRLTLVDDQGRSIEAADVDTDRRPSHVLVAEYPHLDDFAKAYVARFPRSIDLMASKEFRLRIAGVRGTVDLIWAPR
jgi:hypothetical protein